MGYGFWFIWSLLGYANVCLLSFLLAGKVDLVAIVMEYMDFCSSLFDVVYLEGKK